MAADLGCDLEVVCKDTEAVLPRGKGDLLSSFLVKTILRVKYGTIFGALVYQHRSDRDYYGGA